MFFRCPKCKGVWEYPVEKCPECFLKLERLKSEKLKVIGISKVTIPSVFHPRVPYFVLLLEDENGNRWVQKSIKEYKIGEEFSVTRKGNVTLDRVAIWRIKYDFLEAIEGLLEILGGIEVNEQAKILILPGLGRASHSYFRDNTSPEFLEATIRRLLEGGVRAENIKLVGQSFNEISLEACAKKSGLLALCLKNKVQVLDLAKGKFIKKTQDNFNFEISEEVFAADLVVNLPILKIGKAAASENLLKFLKKENYLGLKYLSSDEEIVYALTKHLPPILTLAEAQNVQKADQFVAFLGLVFASFNSLNLDRVFAEITGAKLPEFLKSVKIENIPIVGRAIEEVQQELEKF